MTRHNFVLGRGRSVAAEVLVPGAVLRGALKSSAEAIHEYHQSNLETALLAGGFGFNMHVANGITALGLATGQDVAYVAESANAYLVVERHGEDLLFALVLPSLYVAPSAGVRACRPAAPASSCWGVRDPGRRSSWPRSSLGRAWPGRSRCWRPSPRTSSSTRTRRSGATGRRRANADRRSA